MFYSIENLGNSSQHFVGGGGVRCDGSAPVNNPVCGVAVLVVDVVVTVVVFTLFPAVGVLERVKKDEAHVRPLNTIL